MLILVRLVTWICINEYNSDFEKLDEDGETKWEKSFQIFSKNHCIFAIIRLCRGRRTAVLRSVQVGAIVAGLMAGIVNQAGRFMTITTVHQLTFLRPRFVFETKADVLMM